MARQAVVVVALALLATVAFAAQAPAAAPSGGDTTTPKAALPTFAAVPAGAAGPAGNANEVGTVAGSDAAAAPAESGKGASDTVAAAPVGGPVADGVFGILEGAQSPSSGATTAQVSAVTGAAVAAVAASFFF